MTSVAVVAIAVAVMTQQGLPSLSGISCVQPVTEALWSSISAVCSVILCPVTEASASSSVWFWTDVGPRSSRPEAKV